MQLKMQLINTSQITEADLNRLRECRPIEGKGLVFSTTDSEFGFIALISEEAEYRQSDFADYSPAMQRAIEWSHQQGASYVMLSNDCAEVDFDESDSLLEAIY